MEDSSLQEMTFLNKDDSSKMIKGDNETPVTLS